jgi:hypothetical protein
MCRRCEEVHSCNRRLRETIDDLSERIIDLKEVLSFYELNFFGEEEEEKCIALSATS